uniref:Cytochrome P450 2A13-like n=1 Tax=Gopherus evgoodei TaxID=1825980 RepID=A0A8C4Y7K3_9SAUR
MSPSPSQISERYGPVYTLHLGPRRVVVLCGYRAVTEALLDQAEDFGGRGKQATFDWIFRGYGVAFSNGERAKQLRRLSITTLRNFGVGKRGIEERILEEAHFLLEALRGTKERIHEEIDRVIGRNRTPSMEDRSQMPYTNAVIHEFQRFCDVIPMGLARRVTRDTQFRGYTIPKGTEVYPMLGSVLYDPTQFSNPDTFDPGHFLDGNGQFKKSDAFVPFSIGKRYCFGEMLARMELFLFITSILQNFRFCSPVEPKDIDISPKLVGFATLPRSYEICLVPR